MTRLVALCSIVRTPNNSAATQFAGYDADGNSVVEAVSEEVKAGTVFEEPNDSQVQWLLDNGAARVPTDREEQLFRHFGELLPEAQK